MNSEYIHVNIYILFTYGALIVYTDFILMACSRGVCKISKYTNEIGTDAFLEIT